MPTIHWKPIHPSPSLTKIQKENFESVPVFFFSQLLRRSNFYKQNFSVDIFRSQLLWTHYRSYVCVCTFQVCGSVSVMVLFLIFTIILFAFSSNLIFLHIPIFQNHTTHSSAPHISIIQKFFFCFWKTSTPTLFFFDYAIFFRSQRTWFFHSFSDALCHWIWWLINFLHSHYYTGRKLVQENSPQTCNKKLRKIRKRVGTSCEKDWTARRSTADYFLERYSENINYTQWTCVCELFWVWCRLKMDIT